MRHADLQHEFTNMNIVHAFSFVAALLPSGSASFAQRPAPVVPDAIVDLSETRALALVGGEQPGRESGG